MPTEDGHGEFFDHAWGITPAILFPRSFDHPKGLATVRRKTPKQIVRILVECSGQVTSNKMYQRDLITPAPFP